MARGSRASKRAAVNKASSNAVPITPKRQILQTRTRSMGQPTLPAPLQPATPESDSDDVDDTRLPQLTPPSSASTSASSPAAGDSPEQASSDNEGADQSDAEEDQDDSRISEDGADGSDPEEDEDTGDDGKTDTSSATVVGRDSQSETADSDSDDNKSNEEAEDYNNEYSAIEQYEHSEPDEELNDMTPEEFENYPFLTRPYKPLPKFKITSKKIISHFIPADGIVTLKATRDNNGKVTATLDDSVSAEDAAKLHDFYSILSTSKAFHKALGGQGYRLLHFELIKTTALTGIMTGYREWEVSDGLPPLLSLIKSITIHKSFKQQFGDWCADIDLLAKDKDLGIMELAGLREIIFTEMPAGKDADLTGTCYMPSALEKLRACQSKLKTRGMTVWVVKEGQGFEHEWVTVRLIHDVDVEDEVYGIQDDVSGLLFAALAVETNN
jgi:hypothetical protein